MNLRLIYLLFSISLLIGCADQKKTSADTSFNVSQNQLTSDSLQFKSGIRSIFQDSKGIYWIGSNEEGVARYDGQSFRYFSIDQGLVANQVITIQESEDGTIWINTSQGISSYDGKNLENHSVYPIMERQWEKTEQDLWFAAGTKQGIYRYDNHNLSYHEFPMSSEPPTGNVYAVTGIAKGKNQMLWIATYAGVIGYDGVDFTILNDESLEDQLTYKPMHVRSIFEDSKGRLWIGNNGIGVLLKNKDSVINFSEKHRKLLPLKDFQKNILTKQYSKNTGLQSVFAIAEDTSGTIWFGDRDSGAWSLNGTNLINHTIDSNLKSQMIWSIYKDRNDQLLFGMAEGGVYKFTGSGFEKFFKS